MLHCLLGFSRPNYLLFAYTYKNIIISRHANLLFLNDLFLFNE